MMTALMIILAVLLIIGAYIFIGVYKDTRRIKKNFERRINERKGK